MIAIGAVCAGIEGISLANDKHPKPLHNGVILAGLVIVGIGGLLLIGSAIAAARNYLMARKERRSTNHPVDAESEIQEVPSPEPSISQRRFPIATPPPECQTCSWASNATVVARLRGSQGLRREDAGEELAADQGMHLSRIVQVPVAV